MAARCNIYLMTPIFQLVIGVLIHEANKYIVEAVGKEKNERGGDDGWGWAEQRHEKTSSSLLKVNKHKREKENSVEKYPFEQAVLRIVSLFNSIHSRYRA